MVFDSEDFVFEAPPAIARARRVLIKPVAGYPVGYPVTTSREMMVSIIMGIRQISDADILILDGHLHWRPGSAHVPGPAL